MCVCALGIKIAGHDAAEVEVCAYMHMYVCVFT